MTTDSGPIRVAMWSGPRNISTALMRSWEARGDTSVWDEPFYAHYLLVTGREHPGREEIIRSYETDWRRIADQLTGPIPGDRRIFYQKHMAHHLLPGMVGPWLFSLRNAFLIRDPKEMLVSLARVTAQPSLQDTGLPQQWELFEYLQQHQEPAVVDAADVLRAPEIMLRRLCERLDVPFSPKMLSWAPGPRSSDGIWAKYWYASVEASSGFRPYISHSEALPAGLRDVYEQCLPYYERLYQHRIVSDSN